MIHFFLSNDPLSSVVFLLFAAQDDMNGRKRIRSSSVWFGQISFVTRDSSSQASKQGSRHVVRTREQGEAH